MSIQLRTSTLAAEGPLQASKWLKSPVLLAAEEMEALFKAMGFFYIFKTGSVVHSGKGEVAPSVFLEHYKNYVEHLERGEIPEEMLDRSLFSSVFTVTPDVLYAIPVNDTQQLIRVSKPVIQLQSHRMDHSSADGKFRSMTYGNDSIFWGIQFSYPQLFQDNHILEVKKVQSSEDFPNTQLFHQLQYWIRHHTAPTPFIVEGKCVHVPMRLGKKCFSWINNHPQLKKKNLIVQCK